MKKFALLCFIVSITVLTACSNINLDTDSGTSPKTLSKETLQGATFTFFDVGQGDSALIQADDGTTILIDTGRQDDKRILSYLKERHITKMDLLILTHPHADHIGNADKVINTYKPKEIWMDGLTFNSSTYEKVIDAALATDAIYKEPRRGDEASFGPFNITVLNPDKLSQDANNDSIAIRLTYKDISAIFTGDAEKQREHEMANSKLDLQADIFQLGHHGSSTSNQPFFLDKIKPSVAIYSAEKGNSYGHPHTEVLNWLKMRNIDTYGTDVNGTVTIETNGKKLHIQTEKQGIPKPGSSYPKNNPKKELKTEGKEKPLPEKINVNTASKAQLECLPHIGSRLAEAIIKNRPYKTIDDLKRIKGIGKGIIRQIKEQGIATIQ